MSNGTKSPQAGSKNSYRRLLFLSRVAFICNVFFLLAVSLQFSAWISNEDIVGTVAIIGYVLVVLFNPLVNLCYLILFLLKKPFRTTVPSWLITANLLFLVIQIFYILYLNDTKHY
ncbi:MAG TPA: hypothetical protein VFQ73_17145 [Flavisolibacter sp.]|nr:hypothetical protein [Flavisolibacter sp.]